MSWARGLSANEYSDIYREYHRIALEHYNTAATFNAAGLVAVMFGQFTLLALLEGKGHFLQIGLWFNIPIAFTMMALFAGFGILMLAYYLVAFPMAMLIAVYMIVVALGRYFIVNYFTFANFIEQLRDCDGTKALTTLERKMIDDIEGRFPLVAGLWNSRISAFKSSSYMDVIACALYILMSFGVLNAALWLPAFGH